MQGTHLYDDEPPTCLLQRLCSLVDLPNLQPSPPPLPSGGVQWRKMCSTLLSVTSNSLNIGVVVCTSNLTFSCGESLFWLFPKSCIHIMPWEMVVYRFVSTNFCLLCMLMHFEQLICCETKGHGRYNSAAISYSEFVLQKASNVARKIFQV